MVISAVTFSRQHFFLRSIISASRQNGCVRRNRDTSAAMCGLCGLSRRRVALVTIAREKEQSSVSGTMHPDKLPVLPCLHR